MGRYLGSIHGRGGDARADVPLYAPVDDEYALELRVVDGNPPKVDVELVRTAHEIEPAAAVDAFTTRSDEFLPTTPDSEDGAEGMAPLRAAADLMLDATRCPAGLDAQRRQFPRALDLWFDGPAGNYLLVVRARTNRSPQRVDIALNNHLYGEDRVVQKGSGAFTANDWRREPGLYGRIGAWMLDEQWRTYQIVVPASHRGGRLRHKLELSLAPDGGTVEFEAIELWRTPVQHTTLQYGGHEARLQSSIVLAGEHARLRETRVMRMLADEPTFFLDIRRDMASEAPEEIASFIALRGYDRIRVDGTPMDVGARMDAAPRWIEAEDSSGLRPTLTLFLRTSEGITQAARDSEGLRLIGSVEGAQVVRVAATLRTGASDVLARYLAAGPQEVELDADGASVESDAALEQVRLFRVKNPDKGPYFVQEDGWWRVRGAQPLHKSEAAWEAYLDAHDAWIGDADPEAIPQPPYGDDLVRVRVKPGDAPRLQPYGYIDGCVRPGWGSQKQMLLGDVAAEGCSARVLHVTPYLFAPRVEFAETFASVRLDGQPWAYHDGRHVFLPQRPGTYRIDVERASETTPTLTATAALVESARFDEDVLYLRLGLPAYVFQTPEDLRYNVLIAFDPAQHAVKSVEGGELLRTGPEGAVVRCDGKDVRVLFKRT
jgi:hypothetical protein